MNSVSVNMPVTSEHLNNLRHLFFISNVSYNSKNNHVTVDFIQPIARRDDFEILIRKMEVAINQRFAGLFDELQVVLIPLGMTPLNLKRKEIEV